MTINDSIFHLEEMKKTLQLKIDAIDRAIDTLRHVGSDICIDETKNRPKSTKKETDVPSVPDVVIGGGIRTR